MNGHGDGEGKKQHQGLGLRRLFQKPKRRGFEHPPGPHPMLKCPACRMGIIEVGWLYEDFIGPLHFSRGGVPMEAFYYRRWQDRARDKKTQKEEQARIKNGEGDQE